MLRPRLLLVAALLLVATTVAVGSCSKKSNPVSPPPAGKELNSANLPQGGSYSHTFASAGSFPYHCTIHPSMLASVTVAGGGADSALVNITGSQFSPNSTTMKPGGTVRWVNNDGFSHTVTSD